ncbi:MAG: hypothetical protein IKQ92_03370 [Clostridia bacterium]|nr:hypothetical protein [Clostridia bacterium]
MEDRTKLTEALKGVWNSLTDEQKARASECKTAEELMKFAGEECIELPDEVLDAAAGGYIVYEADANHWTVVRDSNGEVVAFSPTRQGAERVAGMYEGVSADEISVSELEDLRGC